MSGRIRVNPSSYTTMKLVWPTITAPGGPNASAPIGPKFIATMPATTSTNILASVRS